MAAILTDRARQVVSLAEQESRAMNHEYVGTEHILLALAHDDSELVMSVLETFGVDANRLHEEIERLVLRGPDSVRVGKSPLTPRANQAIDFAKDEAQSLGQKYVGTAHLLLGLLREPDGVAGQVLRNLGLDLREIRDNLLRTRLLQLKIVERAVRPVHASTARKRKMREELLAHLSAIYEEEQARCHDPATALVQAQRRFGHPADLARELDAALPASERRAYYLEGWIGWRAPESPSRYMMRMVVLSFLMVGAMAVSIAAPAVLDVVSNQGWNANAWKALRNAAALLLILPIAQFALSLSYIKMRDALCGAAWARKSRFRAFAFDVLLGLIVLTAGLCLVALTEWSVTQPVEWLVPIGAVAVATAIFYLLLAYLHGPTEIADTIWAFLDLEDVPNRIASS